MITEPLFPSVLFPVRKLKTGNRVALPASWMRCGTSKGLFIHRQHLPPLYNDWKPWLLAAMGSRGDDHKQLDGIGGATSTTSKVAVVAESSTPGIDIEYTFAQVGVGKEVVDFTGNCGNIASGVGPFAVEQGLVRTEPGQKYIDIRILNTNTNSVLVETVELDNAGNYQEAGDYRIAGISGSGSEVKVSFLNPAGTMTGQLFPTGRVSDTIFLPASNATVQATLIDSGNPFVLVDASTLPTELTQDILKSPDRLTLDMLESIRRQAAVMMGLATDVKQASQTRGTPKIAVILGPPSADGAMQQNVGQNGADIVVASLSMGKMHPTLQLTGAVAIASALVSRGTIPAQLSLSAVQAPCLPRSSRMVRIAHRSGCIEVEVEYQESASGIIGIDSCSISRTARTLFEGKVHFSL